MPIGPKKVIGLRRLMVGVYRVLLEDRPRKAQRTPDYYEVGTLKNGKLTQSDSPMGKTVLEDPAFPAVLDELREFALVDSVMSE